MRSLGKGAVLMMCSFQNRIMPFYFRDEKRKHKKFFCSVYSEHIHLTGISENNLVYYEMFRKCVHHDWSERVHYISIKHAPYVTRVHC